MYQILKDPQSGETINAVKRISDNACIPFDPANTDYQAYLKWLSEGNAPLEADTPEPAEASE